jgi:hypothetical protein
MSTNIQCEHGVPIDEHCTRCPSGVTFDSAYEADDDCREVQDNTPSLGPFVRADGPSQEQG